QLFAILILITLLGALSSPGQSVQNVTLAWNPSPDSVAGYKLYYGTASHNYTNVIDVGNVTVDMVPNLLAGVTYYFAVTAYDSSAMESGFSNEISFTPGQAALPQITILSLTQTFRTPAPSLMTLQWTSTAGAIYHVLSKDNWALPSWTDLSGPIVGLAGTTS